MDDAARAREMWSQLTGKNLEILTVWADANQRLMKEWVEFASGAAKEGLRLYGELQVKALEGAKAWAEGGYGPQTACHLAEENVQTLTDAVAKTKEIYARAA